MEEPLFQTLSFCQQNKAEKCSVETYVGLMTSASSRVGRNHIYRLHKATLLKAESSMKGVWYDTANTVYGTGVVNGS